MPHLDLSLIELTSYMFAACNSLAELGLKALNLALKLPNNILGTELNQHWSCLDLLD
jgi:hypothetical protein